MDPVVAVVDDDVGGLRLPGGPYCCAVGRGLLVVLGRRLHGAHALDTPAADPVRDHVQRWSVGLVGCVAAVGGWGGFHGSVSVVGVDARARGTLGWSVA